MRALLAQLDWSGTCESAANHATEVVRSNPELDLIAFPELYLSGYDLEKLASTAIGLDAVAIATLREAAADTSTAIAVGFAERRGSEVANSLALIDERGRIADVYRKTHLFGEEQAVFAPGEDLVLAELGGSLIGPMICFDMEFCEPARALALAGANLLLTVSANMEPFYGDHLIASQARALDNRLPHLYVNRCGEEGGLRFVGGTRALRADGSISASAAGAGAEYVVVDVEEPDLSDQRVDYLAHRREDLEIKHRTPQEA